MLKFILTKAFSLLIGNFTPQQKAGFWNKFNALLSEITKAAAEGAVKGAVNK